MALDSKTLVEFLHEKLGVEKGSLDAGTALFSSGRLDSFSMMELMMFIESKSGLELKPSDVTLENLDSVERILDFVTMSSRERLGA